MKKYTVLLLCMACSIPLFSQIDYFECTTEGCTDKDNNGLLYAPLATNETYNSAYGWQMPTTATIRALSVFINIIYDQTPSADPEPNSNDIWPVPTTACINSPVYRPSYMLDLFDINVSPTNTYTSMVTRLYAESSFNNLIILSDFMVVNILQSQIQTTGTNHTFTGTQLLDAVITYINNNGGLNTYYGHNSAADYDVFTGMDRNDTFTLLGREKPMQPDGKIDLSCFFVRNSTSAYGGVYRGSGNANTTYPSSTVKLMIGGQPCSFNNTTYLCEGSGNFTQYKKGAVTHEIAHLLLGSNEMHTSNREGSSGGTFLGLQGGFSLFGGGLLTCNAYERWRLGWKNGITANGVNSDITTQFTGEQTFILRDFVTYGDAIRIKLPYKDKTTSLNQYIWLENHQVGKNNKQDGYKYNDISDCRKVNQAGIYAYYQIGKDILESTTRTNVYTSGESDNLKIISAEGNYNVTYNNNEEDCFGWSGGAGRPKFIYNNQNVFQGVNNQTPVLSYNASNSFLTYLDNFKIMGSKIKNGGFYNNLPWLGSNFDAFVPNPEIKMDISGNPAAVNTITYYLNIDGNKNISQKPIAGSRATRKIYLTGLNIKMINQYPGGSEMKAYTVKVRWDDYDVKQDVNWAGDIVLNEQLNLLENKTITLEQNLTPIQIEKDPVSNFFAPPTTFTCKQGSEIEAQTGSSIILKDNSAFVAENGSRILLDGAVFTVKSGSTLILKSGATLEIENEGKIVVETGGYLCVESGANINMNSYTSVILLKEGATLGANPALGSSMNCITNMSNITTADSGAIFDQSLDVYIQNETLSQNRYYGGRNIYIGRNVTTTKPVGDVLITNNANVIFDAAENVFFEPGFECELGASFEVKNN